MAEETTEPIPRLTTDSPAPAKSKRRRTAILIAVGVLVVAAVGAAVYGMVTSAAVTVRLRDIMIIVLAFTTILIGVFLCVLIIQLQSLITLLRREVKPVIRSASETVSTVRGTTAFLSDAVVSPVISVASYASAVRQALRVLAGGHRSRRETGPDDEPGAA